MRQAGRFLPEYQALKSDYSMHQLFYEKKLIKEITKMPLKRFDVDAAIIFSDILLPLEALGSKIFLEHHKQPLVQVPEKTQIEIKMPLADILSFVYEAINELKNEIQVPLIGFSGGPLTLLTYLFQEKKEGVEFMGLRKWHYEKPQEVKQIIDVITDLVIEHLMLQIQAGADAVQIFDSWAGTFPKPLFLEYAIKPMQKIAEKLRILNVPIIYFSRNLGAHIELVKNLDIDAISVDGSILLADAFKSSFSIQGNFDPALLLTSKDVIQQEVGLQMKKVDPQRWIANLGHGVLPATPIENVEAFIETLHQTKVR